MIIRALEFVKVYWQTWVVAVGPLIFSPLVFLGETQQVKIDTWSPHVINYVG